MSVTRYEEIERYNKAVLDIQREKGLKKISSALPAEGHNTWLIGKLTAPIPFVPYPTRQKLGADLGFKAEFNGHPWIMPFKTVQYVARNLDTLTKEEFIKVLQEDLNSEKIKLDVSYLLQLDDALFPEWFRDIATTGLNANNAWTKNALLVMKCCGIKPEDINCKNLDYDQLWLLDDLRTQIFEAKDAKQIKQLLRILSSKEYYVLQKFLLEVHKNWRNLKGTPDDSQTKEECIFKGDSSFLDVSDQFTEDFHLVWGSLINAGEIFKTFGIEGLKKIDSDIDNLLINVSKSNLPSIVSFNLLLEITDLLSLVTYDSTSTEYVEFMTKLSQKYLEYILLDANPGVINGIMKAAGQADQLEG